MNRLPGLFLTAVITIIAYAISYLPFSPFTLMHNGIAIHPLEPMVIALILGIIAGNTLFISKFANGMKKTNLMGIISSSHIKAKLASGINFSIKVLLPLGIVLMGVKFDLLAVIKLSAQALVINLICIVLAYILTNLICQFLKIDSQMRALITIGTAICGGSAIVALAPVIKANQTQTAIAMTIVSLYGLIAIFIFPLLGQLLGLSQLQFGIWAGTSIQAVPQVIAA
ncbi:MAG: YeiH family protein, partial [Francisellaceae bacterium]